MYLKSDVEKQMEKYDLLISYIQLNGEPITIHATSQGPMRSRLKSFRDDAVMVYDCDARSWSNVFINSIFNIRKSEAQFGLLQERGRTL